MSEQINKVKNWRQFLNEQKEHNSVRLTFYNLTDYHKAEEILYMNGFKRPTSPEIGNGYYKSDDNWKTIEFNENLKDNILQLLKDIDFEIKYVPSIEYKIFNQGGYLD